MHASLEPGISAGAGKGDEKERGKSWGNTVHPMRTFPRANTSV